MKQGRGQAQGPFLEQRQALVKQEIIDAGVTNPRVLDAMLGTPRHEFVPAAYRKHAYLDMSLPIGNGQTISSPFIVAFMTAALDPQPTDRVLEIGTGSGYQAAVLSPLVEAVYTIEIVEPLGKRAAQTLKRLNYGNVHPKVGDGFQGWPEHAPFDKIIVTCSPESVPEPLVQQLREGGRMIVPVGERYQQTLYLFRKAGDQLVREELRPTLFVPMTGTAEDRRQVQPDPAKPALANGSFETLVGAEHDTTPSRQEPASEGPDPIPDDMAESPPLAGWYYQRQVKQMADSQAPDGSHYARLENTTTGRACRLLQGFAVDGRQVGRLAVSAHIRYQDLTRGASLDMRPVLGVTFYDEQRRQVGQRWLGPWLGSRDWHRVESEFPVPSLAREAILRVDLLGATGVLDVDAVRVAGQPR